MILTVTLNLAVDVTYRVDSVRVGETTRVGEVQRRAGGKGVNVARTLHALDLPVAVAGLAGGATGDAIRAELAEAGLPDRSMTVQGPSRTTLMVVDDDGRATGFSESGPEVSPDEWQRWAADYGMLLESADAVVLSGSVPPGIPEHGYAQLITVARRRELPVLLDTGGEHLRRGIEAGPDVVKVNVEELAGIGYTGDPLAAAEQVRGAGGQSGEGGEAMAVVVTLGADGLVAATPEGSWRCRAPEPARGNPTGAGDAVAAALIAGALARTPWPQRLADAVALGTAAVAAPLAGSFDGELYRRLQEQVRAEPA